MPEGIPRADEIGLDGRVALVSVLITFASAVLFGLVPSLQASRTDAAAALRASGDRASTSGRSRARTRAALVIGEVALTLILMVAAGLLGQQLPPPAARGPGIPHRRRDDRDGAAAAGALCRRRTAGRRLRADSRAGVQQRGNVRSAALAFPSPLQGGNAAGRFVDRRPAGTGSRSDRPFAALMAISQRLLFDAGDPADRRAGFHDGGPSPAAERRDREHAAGAEVLRRREPRRQAHPLRSSADAVDHHRRSGRGHAQHGCRGGPVARSSTCRSGISRCRS